MRRGWPAPIDMASRMQQSLAASAAHAQCAEMALRCGAGAARPLAAPVAARGRPLKGACQAALRGDAGTASASASALAPGSCDSSELRKNVWECCDLSSLGMWDGVPEGPSCVFVREPLSAESPERLESLYKQVLLKDASTNAL